MVICKGKEKYLIKMTELFSKETFKTENKMDKENGTLKEEIFMKVCILLKVGHFVNGRK